MAAVDQDASVHLRIDGVVAEITVGDGTRRNALGTAGWERIARLVADISNGGSIRVAIIRGHGETFCAGSNIAEWREATPSEVDASFTAMERAFTAIECCPLPVVAAVRGAATGAGCQLALACDLRVVAETARIGMPIARLGILASPAFARRITCLAGPAVARDLLYTGRLLDGSQAVAAGLANECVPDSEVDARVQRLVGVIVSQPESAILAAKRAVAAAVVQATDERPGQPAVAYQVFQQRIAAFLSRRVLS
jgi:enoyl-CoA hydratase/carnithine racemase